MNTKVALKLLSACTVVGLFVYNAPASAAGVGVNLFECVAAPQVQPPPLPAPGGLTSIHDVPQAVCPAGLVPQPVDLFAEKRRPDLESMTKAADVGPNALTYLYVSGYQYFNAVGMGGNVTQHATYLATADFHTLAELAAQSSNGQQIVEIGWTVDRGLYGDALPRLFVFHWINGQPTCYNGCGYTQVSGTRYPGMAVAVTSTPQNYMIQYYQGNWWVGYQGEWIGYFPGSRWSGTFTSLGLAQWFGEVAANSSLPCTDMGNGLFGTSSGSAVFNGLFFFTSPTTTVGASISPTVTHSTLYNMGARTASSFRWGGPGGC